MPLDTGAQGGRCLADLVSPVDLESFWRDFWPGQPFVTHGPLARLPSVFADPRFADLPTLSSHYRGRVLFGRGRAGPRSILVHDVEAAPLYDMGLSLYLPDIEAMAPECADFLRSLERELGLGEGQARITAWASPAADGIACHFDAEDVFSVQLAGTKRFQVAETPALVHPVGAQYGPGIPPSPDLYPQAAGGFPDPDDVPFTEVVMQPGSVLFLPRGFWHRTEADANSLSISIILSSPPVLDVLLGRLRDLLLQDPAWRMPVHAARLPSENAGSAEGYGAARLAELAGIIASITPADLLGGAEEPAASIGRDTLFQRIPGAPPAGSPDRATYPDGAGDRAFVDWALEGRAAFSLSEASQRFAELGGMRLEALLERLIAEGVLRRLPYRRMPGL
jgi:hypothetical protein